MLGPPGGGGAPGGAPPPYSAAVAPAGIPAPGGAGGGAPGVVPPPGGGLPLLEQVAARQVDGAGPDASTDHLRLSDEDVQSIGIRFHAQVHLLHFLAEGVPPVELQVADRPPLMLDDAGGRR